MRIKIILLLVLVLSNTGWGFYSEIPVDPEISGCGNTGVADIHNAFSAYLNPASISFNKFLTLGASYNYNPSISDYAITGLAVKYFQPLPLGFIFFEEGVKDVVSQKRFIISVGRLLFPSLSFGMNMKILRIEPTGYQEDDNDPLIKSFHIYQYDAGTIFQIIPHIKGGLKISDFILKDNEIKNRIKYNIGLSGDLSGFLLNVDLRIMRSYYNKDQDIQFSIGIKKMITDYIAFSAGLDRLNFCYGIGLLVKDIGFVSGFSLHYGYRYLLGSNHSIGLRCEF